MDMYGGFCDQIDNGVYDEIDGLGRTGLERLNIALAAFIVEGKITAEQLDRLHLRLYKRLIEKRSGEAVP